jgi:hypothetical protein
MSRQQLTGLCTLRPAPARVMYRHFLLTPSTIASVSVPVLRPASRFTKDPSHTSHTTVTKHRLFVVLRLCIFQWHIINSYKFSISRHLVSHTRLQGPTSTTCSTGWETLANIIALSLTPVKTFRSNLHLGYHHIEINIEENPVSHKT